MPTAEQAYDDDDDPFSKPTLQDRTKIPASAHVVEVDGVHRRPYSARLKLWTRPHVPILATLRDGVLRPLPYLKSPVLWWGVAQYGFGQVIFNSESPLRRTLETVALTPLCTHERYERSQCRDPLRATVQLFSDPGGPVLFGADDYDHRLVSPATPIRAHDGSD